MTTHTTDPAIVRTPQLAALIGCSVSTLDTRLSKGLIPRPDERGLGNCKLWRVSTIARWRPDLAADALALATRPQVRLGRQFPPLNSAA